MVGTVSTEAEHFARLEAQIGRPLDRGKLGAQRRQRESELILRAASAAGRAANCLVEGKQRGLKIGLASSAGCPWVVGHLQRLDLLEYFDSVRGRDDVERVKPDPELFLTVLADLGGGRRKPWYSKIRRTASGQPKPPGCCAWQCQTRLRGNTPWRRLIYAWNRWLRCRCTP